MCEEWLVLSGAAARTGVFNKQEEYGRLKNM